MSRVRTVTDSGAAKRVVPRSRRLPARTSRVQRVPRAGQKCPRCRRGQLDYDGLLQLSCSACGYVAEGGIFS